jgi:hypothetical protein
VLSEEEEELELTAGGVAGVGLSERGSEIHWRGREMW